MCLEYHLEFLGTLFGMSGARRAEEQPGSDGRQCDVGTTAARRAVDGAPRVCGVWGPHWGREARAAAARVSGGGAARGRQRATGARRSCARRPSRG